MQQISFSELAYTHKKKGKYILELTSLPSSSS